MKKSKLKDVYTAAASDVADEYYPKGKSDRRGEFLRDAAVLYTKLSDGLDKFIKAHKKKPVALQTMLIVEQVLTYFEEEMHGMYSDEAYAELIEQTEGMLLGTISKADYLKYVELIFGVEDNDCLANIKQKAEKKYKYYREHGHFEFKES